MADEATSTTNSTDQTATTTANDAGTAATDTSASTTTADTSQTDDLGTTALGGAGDDKVNDEAGNTDDTAEGKTTEAAPEKYELTAPEGFTIDEASLEAATPVFKELGLSNEQADKLMPVAADFAKRLVEQRDQQLMGEVLKQRADWLTAAKEDPEIGGPKWDATLQAAARTMDQLGFPKGSRLRTDLNESGFGNHPELIRLMAKVGKAIGEDSDFVRSDANANVKKSPEEILYPNDIPQQGAK